MKRIIFFLLLISCEIIIFSQEPYNGLLSKYELGTDLSQILNDEGTPDAVIYGYYCYNNQNINGYIVNYAYYFLYDKLTHVRIIFQIDRNFEIEHYNYIFNSILNYYIKQDGNIKIMEQDHIETISYWAYWEEKYGFNEYNNDSAFFELLMVIPKNNNIDNFHLSFQYSIRGL